MACLPRCHLSSTRALTLQITAGVFQPRPAPCTWLNRNQAHVGLLRAGDWNGYACGGDAAASSSPEADAAACGAGSEQVPFILGGECRQWGQGAQRQSPPGVELESPCWGPSASLEDSPSTRWFRLCRVDSSQDACWADHTLQQTPRQQSRGGRPCAHEPSSAGSLPRF